MTDLKIIRHEGQVGIQYGDVLRHTHWLNPLDALDLADDLWAAAATVGNEVVEAAREKRKATA